MIVDVGGGIGSTVMLLSTAFASSEDGPDLNFVVQDRPVVVEMGEKVSVSEPCAEISERHL